MAGVEVTANGDALEVPAGSRVTDLLEVLGLGGRWVVVERNGEPVERGAYPSTMLAAGDRLEVVRAVAGG